MSAGKAAILHELAEAVINMDVPGAKRAAESALAFKIDPYEAITEGLAKGMDRVNELFEQEEYFVPEILVCADAMYAGIEMLKPFLPKEATTNRKKAVIGVVKGDTHDIGKNLVRIMLDNAGFEMIDLGRDVPYARFIDTAGEQKADLVCMSTLMTTTMDGMQVIIEDLKKAGLLCKTMVGGGPISPTFAKNINADGYAKNASEAVKVAKGLFQKVPLQILSLSRRERVLVPRAKGDAK
ncbi:MAG: corrinoid protein [Deltaproteobacteria bacterium]|nr:corrinoid protein [Deltaproteobacteria bacterium]